MSTHPSWFDTRALEIAREWTGNEETQCRARLQCQIIQAMKDAVAPRPLVSPYTACDKSNFDAYMAGRISIEQLRDEPPQAAAGIDLLWLNRILLRVSTAASDVETQCKAREQAAAIREFRKFLATPAASTPAAVAPEQVTDADLTERLREWNKSRGYIDDQCVYAVLKQCEALIASRVAPAGLGVAVTDDMERMFSVVGEEVTSDTLVDVIDQAIHNELLGADGSVHLEEWVRLRRWHIDIAAQQKGGGR